MEYYYVILIFIAIIVLVPLAIYVIFKPMIRQNKLLNSVCNYDSLMRNFVFKVDLSKDCFFRQLKTHNVNDVMQYRLNEDLSVITFMRNYTEMSYSIKLKSFENSIVLKIEQATLIGKSNMPYYVNEFWIKKFNAEPLEYEKYAF